MNKRKLILSITAMLVVCSVAGIYLIHTSHSNTIGSGYGVYGKYFATALKDDKIVAKVNGEPVYLSEVAIPFFSSNVSYSGVKESIQNALKDPNVPESTKQEILNQKPMTPVKTLDWVIGLTVLKQQLEKEGIKVNENDVEGTIKQLEASDKLSMENYPENELVQYRKEALNILGISNEQYYEEYYIRLQRLTSAIDKYRATIQAPDPTENEIKQTMDEYNLSRGSAIDRIKGDYIQNVIDKRIEELRKNANIELIGIKAVEDLGKYFEN